MAHTYASNFIHCVFSTKERRSLIPSGRTAELYAYLGGIARGEGFSLIAAGGTANHVHLLFDLPATCSLAGGWGMVFPGRKDTEPSASVPLRLRW
jgi:REP element-mobilizing transposase RayT